MDPRADLERSGEEKDFLPQPGIEPCS